MTRSWSWNAASLVGACILSIAAIFSGTLLIENEGAHPQSVPRSSRRSLLGGEPRSLRTSPFHDPRTVDVKDVQIGGVQGLGLYSSPKTSERPTTTRPETFKVVILTMDRLASLKRLVDSLSHPDCAYGGFGMGVDLIFHVDRPKTGKDTAAWMETVRWTVEDVTWPHGSISTLVANENMGLRKAWLEAWHPESDDDRAIILEDDVTVSPLWYRWVNGAYDAYGHDGGRIAGFSLQRQDLVPLQSKRTSVRVPTNDNEPFLYSLIGSIGFAPNARVWRNFLDWAECAIDNDVDVSVDGLVTSTWWKHLDKRGMWTQHFIYYMNRLGLGCLYHFPKDASKALGAHWREKGEHFGRSEGASHDVVTDPGEISNLVFPQDLNGYDFGAAPIKPWSRPATLVVAAAVGYSADVFEIFVGTLRQHYGGDALLIVAKDPPPEILSVLEKNRVFYREYFGDNASGQGVAIWARFNIERFKFYREVCQEYDYCMALDFRDSLFQGDPFGYLRTEPALANSELVTQSHAHIWDFTDNAAGEIKHHIKMIPFCNIPDGLDFKECMTGKPLINAGGFVGRPSAFEKLEKVVNLIAKHGCSDQMAVNIGVHCGLEGLGESSAVPLQGTGHGPINSVGYRSVFTEVGESFGDLDCMPSPVVHQFNLMKVRPHRNPAKEPLFSAGQAVLAQAG